MRGNTKAVTIMNGQIIILGQNIVATTNLAVKFCPKQLFASTSVLLQTFNCSSAVAWVYRWLCHSEIMTYRCQACGQLDQSGVTQWQESLMHQSKMAERHWNMFYCPESFLWTITVCSYDSKIENPPNKSHQFITDKRWKLLIYWFEILRACDLE